MRLDERIVFLKTSNFLPGSIPSEILFLVFARVENAKFPADKDTSNFSFGLRCVAGAQVKIYCQQHEIGRAT